MRRPTHAAGYSWRKWQDPIVYRRSRLLRADGRAGWSEERRAKFRATLAVKYPKGAAAARVRADLIGAELAELRVTVAGLVDRIAALEERPAVTGELRLVEWRPDHRRQADGGRAVRAQRREVGLPKRPRAVA